MSNPDLLQPSENSNRYAVLINGAAYPVEAHNLLQDASESPIGVLAKQGRGVFVVDSQADAQAFAMNVRTDDRTSRSSLWLYPVAATGPQANSDEILHPVLRNVQQVWEHTPNDPYEFAPLDINAFEHKYETGAGFFVGRLDEHLSKSLIDDDGEWVHKAGHPFVVTYQGEGHLHVYTWDVKSNQWHGLVIEEGDHDIQPILQNTHIMISGTPQTLEAIAEIQQKGHLPNAQR
jgi:hypothetical protein